MPEGNKKIFVGNLSFKTTDEALRAFFEQAGAVTSAVVMKDRMDGRPRGFGFVEMESVEGMQKAIEMLDGKELDGRPIRANEARPLEARPPRRDFGSRPPRRDFGGQHNDDMADIA